jgi:DNA-binding GntR family transcriptional regulator
MIKEHENIYEAIAQRSVDKAQKAVRTHMENAERTLLKVIEAKEKASEEKQKKEGKA